MSVVVWWEVGFRRENTGDHQDHTPHRTITSPPSSSQAPFAFPGSNLLAVVSVKCRLEWCLRYGVVGVVVDELTKGHVSNGRCRESYGCPGRTPPCRKRCRSM